MPRCPNGTRRNKKTGLCEPKTNINTKANNKTTKKKVKQSKKTKKCPSGKILNPKTNRCIKNTTANRKKVGLVQIPKDILVKSKNKSKIKTLSKNIKSSAIVKCPIGKILNPNTNKCVKDTIQNRIKFNVPKSPKLEKLTNIDNLYCTDDKVSTLIDLDLIKVVSGNCVNTNFSKNENVTKEMKSNKLIYLKNDLCNVTFISSGGYGSVFKYSDSTNKYNVALKSYTRSNDNEIKVVRLLKKRNIPCAIVNMRLIKLSKNTYSVMDLMNGDMQIFRENPSLLNNKNILFIILEIAKHLNCLNENKLSYTDLKLANVLFKCIGNNVMKVCIGDAGGICEKIPHKQNPSTYTPWEYRQFKGFPKCTEETMVWCLGVFCIDLLGLNVEPFFYEEIFKYKQNYNDQLKFMDIINKLAIDPLVLNLLPNREFSNLFLSMLNLDPKKRIKLKNIISELSNNLSF